MKCPSFCRCSSHDDARSQHGVDGAAGAVHRGTSNLAPPQSGKQALEIQDTDPDASVATDNPAHIIPL